MHGTSDKLFSLARILVEETTQRNILYLMSFYYTAPRVGRSMYLA